VSPVARLRITTDAPGEFVGYRLWIDDSRIDPFWNDVPFSFKANCPSKLDCEPPPHECPQETAIDVAIDSTARDFWSFRRALLDFASRRFPDWSDRLEADVGVMLAELMSAAGDEMAYYQDRIAREGALETATQRRSLRRLARLVDYEIHDGRGARAWIDVPVDLPQQLDHRSRSTKETHPWQPRQSRRSTRFSGMRRRPRRPRPSTARSSRTRASTA